MNRRLLLGGLAVALVGFTLSGCAFLRPGSTVEDQARDARALCYSAASIGTAAALEQRPEWRPAFELAFQSLELALADNKITGQDLRDILGKLPVRELESRTARIAIDSASMLFDTITGKPVDLEQAPVILAAATGIRDGMAVGLDR